MSSDPQLDPLVRDVPLPDGLLARIQASIVPTDQQLDAQLCQVEVPLGLLDRLRDLPQDVVTDEALKNVSVSFDIVWRARRKSMRARIGFALRRVANMAAALLLFVAISSAFLGSAAAFVVALHSLAMPGDELPFVLVDNSPLAFDAATDPPIHFVALAPLAAHDMSADDASLADAAFNIDSPPSPLWPSDGPDVQWISALQRGVDPLDNVVLLRWGILGYPQFEEDLIPALESPQMPAAAGMEFPPVRGYDRAFAVRHGVFPPIDPAKHPALSEVDLPLTTATSSYHLTRQLARQGRWPAPSQVRTEDFLAAMDYRFPSADPGELAIRTAAGPSPFGPRGAGLLQIAAVAGGLPLSDESGSHLVLAIDMSRSMARGQRLDMVQTAVSRLLTHLGAHDRLSLVVFDEEVRQVVEGATVAETTQLGRLVTELRPRGGTDLAAGLQQAAAVALAGKTDADQPARIVLVTDSQAAMPKATESLMTELLATASAGGVQLAVLDVGDQPQIDETLHGWAQMMGGALQRPESIDDACRLLVEALHNQSTVVGRNVKMHVQFHPRVVAAYRLIGHEANPLGSLQPADHAAELRVGEAATSLLEVWFHSNDDDEVGKVELTWRDASGRTQRRRQRISRLQFAPTWQQSPLTLQQAAIAAQAAEVLRGSRRSLRELNLIPQQKETIDRLRVTATMVHPRLAQRPQHQDLLELLRQLSDSRER